MNCPETAVGGRPCWQWHAGLQLPRPARAADPPCSSGPPVRGCALRGLLIHLSVHEPVDDLCKKAASLCAGEEMLGIAAAPGWLGKPFTCAAAIPSISSPAHRLAAFL